MVSSVTILRRRAGGEVATDATRPPILPLFVAGFLGAAVVRSTGIVPHGVLGGLRTVETMVLAAALFGPGTGVRLSRLAGWAVARCSSAWGRG